MPLEYPEISPPLPMLIRLDHVVAQSCRGAIVTIYSERRVEFRQTLPSYDGRGPNDCNSLLRSDPSEVTTP
eukprot:scaffold2767_cov177-Amphora_coffeaeformis.AAC.93